MRTVLAVVLVLISLTVIVVPTLLVRGCTIGDTELKNPRGSVIKVFNHYVQQVQSMDIEEYIKGVVAAEMPASFEMEALKAQAVVARTYVWRRVLKGQRAVEDPEAVISTNSQSAQAWLSKEDLQEKWGLVNYLFNWNKVARAVEETRDQVLTYNKMLIDALYHSNGGGCTEDAVYVWGNTVPYLKSVPSEYDSQANNYCQEFVFSWEDLDQKLNTNLLQCITDNREPQEYTLQNNEQELIEILEVSPSERVLQMRIDGGIFTGVELRSQLGLPSTKFAVTVIPEGIEFTTYGNGHGVGMSQYGANGMAKSGSSYLEILHYYYHGVQLSRITGIKQ